MEHVLCSAADSATFCSPPAQPPLLVLYSTVNRASTNEDVQIEFQTSASGCWGSNQGTEFGNASKDFFRPFPNVLNT
jgi:hypothetical protein